MKIRSHRQPLSRPLCWACTLIGAVAAFAVLAAFAPAKPVYASISTSAAMWQGR